MEGPAYKFFRCRWTDAWYRLTPAEQGEVAAKEAQLRQHLGVKNLAFCDAGWSNELWSMWGVHEYPNLDVAKKHYQGMSAMGLFRYMESKTMLGARLGG
jgi:hypothetical protein